MFDNLIPLYMYRGGRLDRPQNLYDYLLAEQGLVKRLETRYTSVDHLLVPINETLIGLRLRPYSLHPLRLKVPRIPGRLLLEVLADARRNLDLEFLYHFRYTPGQGWLVTRPEQDSSSLRVGYVNPDPVGLVLELHSHNRMRAFFSATDDADEQGSHFYAVIGRLDRSRPELALRLGLYGHWFRDVPALALFDDLGPFDEVYVYADWPEEAAAETGHWLSSLFPWRSK